MICFYIELLFYHIPNCHAIQNILVFCTDGLSVNALFEAMNSALQIH